MIANLTNTITNDDRTTADLNELGSEVQPLTVDELAMIGGGDVTVVIA
ncbi:hypothetical protein [Usitatibacter palustris]|uniref:Uncharacterized protein n=1 Tax=Usitatibacter palustris TaxID=2732487 RepID=A0A6M4HAM7_9PROT|nr:hypothetical protein [Usitatibacter palustris]QJR15097.1 hypothetical protein DSM104440_01914 [Usitatibacter palustris]